MFCLDAGFCFLGSNVVLLLHVKPDNSSYNCCLLFSELTPTIGSKRNSGKLFLFLYFLLAL